MYEDEIPVGKAKDLRGQVFGRLTVLYRTKGRNGKGAYWKCLCECGNTKEIIGSNLIRGHTLSCGCYKKEKSSNDLTGKRFGKLVAIKPTGNKRRQYIEWECLCDCGNTTYVTSGDLNYGSVISCGCAIRDHAIELGKSKKQDLLNQKFGMLTVIDKASNGDSGRVKWKCRCDCGEIIEVFACALKSGNSTSCGCSKSKGELFISKLLKSHNILFTQQATFDSCRFKNTNALAKFDFYINNKYLVEFDGEQHYRGWYGQEDSLTMIQERDTYKNQWCKDNNIPLIRIPYTKLNTLTIEDLMLETTQFRVV
jgi:hypothetical protein